MLDDLCVVCVFSEVKMTRLMWVETNLTSVCGFFRLQRRRSPSRPSWGLSPPSARRFVSPNKKTLSIGKASLPARIETMVTLGQLLINPFYEEHDLCILITFFLKPECLLWFWPNHIFRYGPGTRPPLYKYLLCPSQPQRNYLKPCQDSKPLNLVANDAEMKHGCHQFWSIPLRNLCSDSLWRCSPPGWGSCWVRREVGDQAAEGGWQARR